MGDAEGMAGEDTWWTAFSAGAASMPACLQGTGATPSVGGGIVNLVCVLVVMTSVLDVVD